MTSPFQSRASQTVEWRPLLLALIGRGTRALDDGATEKAVHEARKACKRSRAAAALLRDGLGRPAARHLDHTLRDAARAIGPARDADVMRALVRTLQLDVALSDPEDDREGCGQIALQALRRAEDLIGGLDLSNLTSDVVLAGVSRSYGRARKAHRAAARERTATSLHTWRKATKQLLYQLELVTPFYEGALKPLVSLVDDLQEGLGEHHDLSVLAELAPGSAGAGSDLAARSTRVEGRVVAAGDWLFSADRKRFERWLRALVSAV